MITCAEFIDFVTRFVEGELPNHEQRVFDQHLDICPDCQSFLSSYRTTIRLEALAFADPDGPVPEEVPDELIQAVLAASSGS